MVGRRNRAFDAVEFIDLFTSLERQLASPDGDTRIAAWQADGDAGGGAATDANAVSSQGTKAAVVASVPARSALMVRCRAWRSARGDSGGQAARCAWLATPSPV